MYKTYIQDRVYNITHINNNLNLKLVLCLHSQCIQAFISKYVENTRIKYEVISKPL